MNRWWVLTFLALINLLWQGVALAQIEHDVASCDEFLQPKRLAKGKLVGPDSCAMQETAVTFEARSFHRLDMGLNGTVDGYLSEEGDYREYLTNVPDLVFPQTLDPGPVHHAVASYKREKGAAMTVIYPVDKNTWNGKMWVTVHGRGRSFKSGSLKAWNRNRDRSSPLNDLSKIEKVMLSKGYVLVKTHRTSAEGLGEIEAVLENGTTVDYAAFNDSARYIMDFTAVAESAVERRLGQPPVRTYFYGHSAGGRIGRGINYTPGLNVGSDGKPMFDAILADDSAAGTWLPIVMKDGKDALFATEGERAGFVPQIDVTHQSYNNVWDHPMPEWLTRSFLHNKRLNAKILRDKGLSDRHRMYEVRSASHSEGGSEPDLTPNPDNLNFSLLYDGLIDLLDSWVSEGTPPPPTRSDWAELGDADGDGEIENPAIMFPEVACPLGVWAPTSMGSGSMFFSAFTGEPEMEPFDEDQVFVDMNRNGVRDFRETPTQAWRRLGLLSSTETLTREKYEACVNQATNQLKADGFFTGKTVQRYVQNAKQADLNPKPAEEQKEPGNGWRN